MKIDPLTGGNIIPNLKPIDSLTSDAIRRIKFHVQCCINRDRSLSITLAQIYRNWGYRELVTSLATTEYMRITEQAASGWDDMTVEGLKACAVSDKINNHVRDNLEHTVSLIPEHIRQSLHKKEV